MEKLNNYLKLQSEIYSYFNYKEAWESFPIVDYTKYYWTIKEDCVMFWNEMPSCELEEYEYGIINNEIYKKTNETMIKVDTHEDGNIFLAIFDNDKSVNYKEEME